MSTDNEGSSTYEIEETISKSPQARIRESLQFIVFDFRHTSSQPIKGRLINSNEPQEENTNYVALLEEELQDNDLSATIMSESETEAIFSKRNIHSNNILKYAKIAFINEETSPTVTHKLIYSERLTKFGTCFSEGECLLEDASDLMAFSVPSNLDMKVVMDMANSYYHHQSNIEAFFMKQKLYRDLSIQSQIKQEVSMIHLLLQKPIQIKVKNPLNYNSFETLIVECYNTDTYCELKEKLREQFPDRSFELSDIRVTYEVQEKDEKECIMTLMKETDFDNDTNGPSILRYTSKKFFHQTDIPLLHRTSSCFRKIIVKHASKELPAFVDIHWSTAQLREEIAKLTHCYPQSLNLRMVISDGMDRPIPETNSIHPYVDENKLIRTGIREKVELMIIVKDLCGMKRFIIYMYDLNTTDDLRLELATHLDVDPFHIDLFHGKSTLQSSSFKNLGFRRKEEIHVEVERQRIRIRALYVNGNERRKKWLIIDEPDVLTVKDILEFWAVEAVCEDSNLRIIFKHKCLVGTPSIKEANITHGSTIFICHCSSSFDEKTVPGKIKGIIEANETGEMHFRFAVTMKGMAFYCNQDFDYERNVSLLRKQRSEERKARKLPSGIRIDFSHSPALTEGSPATPKSTTPKLFSFPSVNKDAGDISPTIHGGEYGMFSPRVKRKIEFDKKENSIVTTSCVGIESNQKNKVDYLSCKSFPLQKAKKRRTSSSTIPGNKRPKSSDKEYLPDFQTLLNKREGELQILRNFETENNSQMIQSKKANSVCMDFDYSSHRKFVASSNLVKQSRNTTKLYSIPGAPGFIRENSNVSYDYISRMRHMFSSSDHESPRLFEIDHAHPVRYGLDDTDGPCTIPKKGIPEKTLHDISKIVTCKWKILARELGLESPVVNKIEERSDNDVEEKIYQTLMAWKQKDGARATLSELIKAFQILEQNETAERIQDLISD